MAGNQNSGRQDNDQGKGNFGNEAQHQKAGEAARDSGNVNYHEIGRKGGKAAQQSGNAHELTDDERSAGGKARAEETDMSELGEKGAEARWGNDED